MTDAPSLRLDKWLWYARLARTRSVAARLCETGLVSVGGTLVLKPHHPIRVGDAVAVAHGRVRRRVVVAALGERRGPSAAARRLYEERDEPLPLSADEAAWTSLFDEGAESGAGPDPG